MAATAINGIRLSKSGAKAGLMADGGFDTGWRVVRSMGWRGRRLAQSAVKPEIQPKKIRQCLIKKNGNKSQLFS